MQEYFFDQLVPQNIPIIATLVKQFQYLVRARDEEGTYLQSFSFLNIYKRDTGHELHNSECLFTGLMMFQEICFLNVEQ